MASPDEAHSNESAMLCPSATPHKTQDFSDNLVCPRYWENSIPLDCDVPEPPEQNLLFFSSISWKDFSRFLDAFLHSRHTSQISSHSDAVYLPGSMLSLLKFSHFLQMGFSCKKCPFMPWKRWRLTMLYYSWAVVAFHRCGFSSC